jgi:hypothetical protein
MNKYKHLEGFGMFRRDPMFERRMDAKQIFARNYAENLVKEIDNHVEKGETLYFEMYYYLGAIMKHCVHMHNKIEKNKPREDSPKLRDVTYTDEAHNPTTEQIEAIGYPLIDHLRIFKARYKGLKYMVWKSQSYQTSLKQLKQLVDVCEKNNLSVYMTAQDNEYFPGHTFLVSIGGGKEK